MQVQIMSGEYKGFVGHLSWDEDGTEWIVVHSMGYTRDVQAKWEEVKN